MSKKAIDAARERHKDQRFIWRAADASLVERALAAGGQRAIEWAIFRAVRSPYTFDYWLGAAIGRAGIGYGDGD